jgi:hypothetical protein
MFKPYGMSGFWRRAMFTFFSFLNLSYAKSSKKEEVLLFFKKLWPLDCGHQLIRCADYLIPNDLSKIDAVFSPGIGLSSDFELYFAKKGIQCYLADASVEGPFTPHNNFKFFKKYIAAKTHGNFISLDDWVSKLYPKGTNALLQMDIESYEFETLISANDDILKKFRIIVLELHCLNILNTQEGLLLCTLTLEKILKHFNVCHFHVNNGVHPLRFKGLKFPGVIELTFLRRDRCTQNIPVDKLPHLLDVVSFPNKPDPIFYLEFHGGVIK